MADVMRRGDAARRAADALLRGVGGRVVLLRMAAPAVAGLETEELGLVAPGFQDVELGPAVFRKARPTVDATEAERWELLVSATTVMGLTGTTDAGTAFAMFAEAVGVVVDGALLEIESASSSDMTGTPYVYRLRLRQAPAVLV